MNGVANCANIQSQKGNYKRVKSIKMEMLNQKEFAIPAFESIISSNDNFDNVSNDLYIFKDCFHVNKQLIMT